MEISRILKPVILGAILGLLALLTLACESAAPTPTPVQPAQPALPVAPTAIPQATATLAPGAPAPTAAVATPTRVLPTPTVVATDKITYGGALKFAIDRDGDNLDPNFSNETGFQATLYAVFNNMVQLAGDNSVQPDIARSWEVSPDGKIVTFKLVTGMKFQDGTLLDAKAVKWNFDRFLDKNSGSTRLSQLSPPLQRVEVVDDSRVAFYMSEPFRPLLATLTERAGMIASPAAVTKANSYANRNGDFGKKPVGSGPYKLDEWIPGSHMKMSRFADYWDKNKQYLDSIWSPMISDLQVIFAMVRTGELDGMERVRPEDIPIIKRNPNLSLVEYKGTRYRGFEFRISKKPWDNKALRQAFSYALDRDTLVRVGFDNVATPAFTILGPAYGVWYDPTLKPLPYNVQKAKEKLSEAGYPNGFTFDFLCTGTSSEIQWCEQTQAVLAGAGINAKIIPLESRTYFTRFVNREIDMVYTGRSPRAEPHITLQRIYHSKGFSNIHDYSNPEVDKLIDQATGTYDVAKAKELYKQVLTITTEDAPIIFVLFETALYTFDTDVRNFQPRIDGVPRFRDIWLFK